MTIYVLFMICDKDLDDPMKVSIAGVFTSEEKVVESIKKRRKYRNLGKRKFRCIGISGGIDSDNHEMWSYGKEAILADVYQNYKDTEALEL